MYLSKTLYSLFVLVQPRKTFFPIFGQGPFPKITGKSPDLYFFYEDCLCLIAKMCRCSISSWSSRTTVRSAYPKNNFLISQPKHNVVGT